MFFRSLFFHQYHLCGLRFVCGCVGYPLVNFRRFHKACWSSEGDCRLFPVTNYSVEKYDRNKQLVFSPRFFQDKSRCSLTGQTEFQEYHPAFFHCRISKWITRKVIKLCWCEISVVWTSQTVKAGEQNCSLSNFTRTGEGSCSSARPPMWSLPCQKGRYTLLNS